jgi:L-iditol 2-dehydrogenase
MGQQTVMDTTMEALVLAEPKRFSVEQIDVPTPGRHEALCRVRAIAICGTDPHIIGGDFPGFWPPYHPFIPGHEWAGEIVALGDEADRFGWQVGDRVAGSSHAGCGFCRQCQIGRYNLCENYGEPGIHAQYGHTAPGAYATYVVHSIKSLTHLPDDIDFDTGAMVDTTSIAMHTVNRAHVRPGDTVVVVGAGVMGLLLAECARAVGSGRVIVVGRGARLQRAGRLGYECVDSSAEDPVSRVREMTEGLGVEIALESAGTALTVRMCLQMLRKGGRVSVIGLPLDDVELPIRDLVLNEWEVVGTRANAGEMADVIPLIQNGSIRAQELITHHFPLSEFPEAYRVFTERIDGALKVIVNP